MIHSSSRFFALKEFAIRAACVFLTDTMYANLLLVHSKKLGNYSGMC